MINTKERYVGALVGAYMDAILQPQEQKDIYPALASAEMLHKRSVELLTERWQSFCGFCDQMIKNPTENPRYFHPQKTTPIIPHVVAVALLFARQPDRRSRFIAQMYRDKSEDSQDFALLYATTLCELLAGKRPTEAAGFARRFHLGGGTFSDLKFQTAWILKASNHSNFTLLQGSGYAGALLGAEDPEFWCDKYADERSLVTSLAVKMYDLSQKTKVKTPQQYSEEEKGRRPK